MTDMFGAAPPALANPPQFSADYWTKFPRAQHPDTIHKVNTHPDGSKEFFTATGQRFRRKAGEVTQLVMPGAKVMIEVINNELITGMFMPEVNAWAFRMTAQDLADYTRELSGALHAQRLKARELMLQTVTEALLVGLVELDLIPEQPNYEGTQVSEDSMASARHLALVAIGALESGPGGEQ